MTDILDLIGPNVHPAFGAALTRNEEYASALDRFDWQFTFSDDYRYVQTQRAILKVMQAEQKAIDPDFEVWNAHAPLECWNGRVLL